MKGLKMWRICDETFNFPKYPWRFSWDLSLLKLLQFCMKVSQTQTIQLNSLLTVSSISR